MNLGDFRLGATFSFPFPTDVGGVPTALAGSPTFGAYGDDGSGPLAGVTLTGSGGDYTLTVVATVGNGYVSGVNYTVKLITGTLGGITISPRAIGYFSINARSFEGIKKNQALTAFPFEMVLTSGSAGTGLSVTATRKLDGGSFAACANSPTEVSAGLYVINLAAVDVNGDFVTLRFTASGAVQSEVVFKTVP